MSYIVTGMTEYIKTEGFPLIVKAVTEGRTASLVNVITGLKGEAAVPFLTSAITLKAGGSCGAFNGAGSVSTFSEVRIGVMPILFEEQVCVPALEGKVLVYETTGSDNLPYAQVFLDDKVKNISKGLDQLTWLGSTAGGDPTNGFTVQGAALMETVTGSTANVYDALDILIDAAVANDSTFESSETVGIFLNYAKYRQLQKEIVAKDYFAYNLSNMGDNNLELTFPGTRIKVYATEGLSGHNFAYLADLTHLHVGSNLVSESEGVVSFYDMPSNSILLRSQFYYGVGVSKAFFKKAI